MVRECTCSGVTVGTKGDLAQTGLPGLQSRVWTTAAADPGETLVQSPEDGAVSTGKL